MVVRSDMNEVATIPPDQPVEDQAEPVKHAGGELLDDIFGDLKGGPSGVEVAPLMQSEVRQRKVSHRKIIIHDNGEVCAKTYNKVCPHGEDDPHHEDPPMYHEAEGNCGKLNLHFHVLYLYLAIRKVRFYILYIVQVRDIGSEGVSTNLFFCQSKIWVHKFHATITLVGTYTRKCTSLPLYTYLPFMLHNIEKKR